jgi:hypothetical protein
VLNGFRIPTSLRALMTPCYHTETCYSCQLLGGRASNDADYVMEAVEGSGHDLYIKVLTSLSRSFRDDLFFRRALAEP